jgi:hypothetical protein
MYRFKTKIMRYLHISFFALLLLTGFTGCSDFLNVDPQAVLSEDEVDNPDKLVIAAYSALGNDHYDAPYSLWPYGNVRSDDAYKGGGGEGDIQAFHFYEISSNISPTFGEPDALWYNMYVAISRTNAALRVLNKVNENDFALKNERMGEMRFIRGHFYFLLKVLFKNIPYIDETVDVADYGSISNVSLDNDALWGKIAADFEFAYNNLPETQTEKGRVNKFAAAAYLAKTRLYKAYRQDTQNNVTSIDAADLNEVVKYTQEVINSSYHLEPDMAHNFLPGVYENGPEAIFAIQFSHDDGTKYGRLNFGELLSVPQGLGCCDFHKPSQNLVNAYKTENGLPLFGDYNDNDYVKETNEADPRLFHTVALPDLPYKYNTNRIYLASWNRNPSVYGYYASLKENVDPDYEGFVNMSPFYANDKNRIVIRFADVLLMRAEALIELNRAAEALPLINQLRSRAQESESMISYAPNMNISLYQDGVNCTWTTDYARTALRWERRLEMAMEGSRFFDLVRWGIADQVINDFYTTESSKRTYYKGAHFIKNKHEYLPIPQQQINFSKGVYKQNYGWE